MNVYDLLNYLHFVWYRFDSLTSENVVNLIHSTSQLCQQNARPAAVNLGVIMDCDFKLDEQTLRPKLACITFSAYIKLNSLELKALAWL